MSISLADVLRIFQFYCLYTFSDALLGEYNAGCYRRDRPCSVPKPVDIQKHVNAPNSIVNPNAYLGKLGFCSKGVAGTG